MRMPDLTPFALFALSAPLAAQDALPPGVWTNTEDAYFAAEEGRERPETAMIEVGADGRWRRIDAFGQPLGEWQAGMILDLSPRPGGGWQIGGSELRRARPFDCWISVRKFAGKPDGSADWTFDANLRTFDQGGRIRLPGNGAAPDVTIRLRNVTWAKGSRNKPSLVIYAHRDDPERAESYSWTSPDATLVGLNLRWVQASCSPVQSAETAMPDSASLVAAGESWRMHYESGEWQALRALYEDDASLMTAGQPRIDGGDAIVTYLRRLSDSGASARFRFVPEDAVVDLPYGFVTARYRMDIAFPGRAEPVVAAGRSLLVYKWRDGTWRLWRDMDNLAPDANGETIPSAEPLAISPGAM